MLCEALAIKVDAKLTLHLIRGRIGAPRSAWIVSCFGAMPCL